MSEQKQLKHRQNLTIRRVLEYTNSNSLGLTIPHSFVEKLELKHGDYLRMEMYPNQQGFTVELLDLG